MTNLEIQAIASEDIRDTAMDSGCVKEAASVPASGKREITKVLQISNEYVRDFYATANPQDRKWIKQRIAQLPLEVGAARYFGKFRAEFAKKFLPHIVASKAKVSRKSLLDNLVEIDKADVA